MVILSEICQGKKCKLLALVAFADFAASMWVCKHCGCTAGGARAKGYNVDLPYQVKRCCASVELRGASSINLDNWGHGLESV